MSGVDGPKIPLKEVNIQFSSSEADPVLESKDDSSLKSLPNRRINYLTWLKYISLVVLVVQNAGQVLLMRYASQRSGQPFLKTVAVFFNEIVKLVAALVLLAISNQSISKTLVDLRQYFIYNLWDTLKVGVPAFIYTIQNFLLYVAIEHLDAGTYMVTYQLKVLTTALFTVIMLKRRLSIPQWLSLVVLCVGVAIVQISASQNKKSPLNLIANMTEGVDSLNATTTTTTTTQATPTSLPPEQMPIVGFAAVITACFLSGFAGIYFEKILKGSNVSLWLRNVQLSFLSIPIGVAVICIKDGDRVMEHGLMVGFDWIVWSVVLLQALGGLIVAVVIKYADNILKAFATSIAIVVSCVASIFIFAIIPKMLFVLGAGLVICAVVIYGIFPYKAKAAQTNEEEKSNGVEVVADVSNC
uniref:UDP-galactose transporter n=1 Tax=Ditylenchus dipsaci TaxID=166011 RepID=A0A915E0V5_9BILA